MINLYTESEVQIALVRAKVALLLISQKIGTSFYFLNPPLYALYKNLQYDIFCLYTTVNEEIGFVDFTIVPDSYTLSFYGLVGAMIEKTKQVDVFGAYDGAVNPYYQAPGEVVQIVNPGSYLPPALIPWAQITTDNSGDGGITRNTYYNSAWANVIPLLALPSPAMTYLFLNIDYQLVVGGGFQLIKDFAGTGFNGIGDGQDILVLGYTNAA